MRKLYVKTALTDVWSSPGDDPETARLTQALLGDAVEVEQERGGWVFGRVEDGYRGWLPASALTPEAPPPGREVLVCVPRAQLFREGLRAGAEEQQLPAHAFLGTRLVELGRLGETVEVAFPGGRALIAASAVNRLPSVSDAQGVPRAALYYARLLLSSPYLLGGITCSGVDCSGLVYIAYRTAGVILPRDADWQYDYTKEVASPAPGDLVFFATEEPGFPAHVGLYLGEECFLHASSRLGGVVVTSLHSPFYRRCYLGAHRLTFAKEGFPGAESEDTTRISI
jgi:hypothetical protein